MTSSIPTQSETLFQEQPFSKISPQNQGDEINEKLELLEEEAKKQEALNAADIFSQLPEIDPSELNVPVNPIFDDHFSSTAPLLNIAKIVFGPIAIQHKMTLPTMAILGNTLASANSAFTPGLVGLGATGASIYFLKNQVQDLAQGALKIKNKIDWNADTIKQISKAFLGISFGFGGMYAGLSMLTSAHRINQVLGAALTTTSLIKFGKNCVKFNQQAKKVDWEKPSLSGVFSSAWKVAKTGVGVYGLLSGLGMLSTAYSTTGAIGMALSATSIATGLYSLYSSDDKPKQTSSSWGWNLLKGAGKMGAIAYGTLSGLGATLGLYSMPGVEALANGLNALTSYASFGSGLTMAASQILENNLIGIPLSLGIMLATSALYFMITNKAYRGLNAEVEKITASNKYGSTLETLEGVSQKEYRQLLEEHLGKDFESMKECFEPLRSRDPEFPENAAKPVVARLLVLNHELTGPGGAVEKYAKLIEAGDLAAITEFLNKELRPKLMMQVYLKHCILSPTRPQFGVVSGTENTQEYFSHVSHLMGMPIKMPLEQVDLNNIQVEAEQILLKEKQLQQQYYFIKALQEKMQQQAQEKQSA